MLRLISRIFQRARSMTATFAACRRLDRSRTVDAAGSCRWPSRARVHVGGLVDLGPRHARQMRQHAIVPFGIDDADRVARGDQALHERTGQPRLARVRIAVDQRVDPAGGIVTGPDVAATHPMEMRCREESGMTRRSGRICSVMAARDPCSVDAGEDPVHSLPDGGGYLPGSR